MIRKAIIAELNERSVMIAQWENEFISLSGLLVAWVQFPTVAEYFKGVFLADHTMPTHPEPARQKIAQKSLNGTTKPVEIKEEGRSPTADKQWAR